MPATYQLILCRSYIDFLLTFVALSCKCLMYFLFRTFLFFVYTISNNKFFNHEFGLVLRAENWANLITRIKAIQAHIMPYGYYCRPHSMSPPSWSPPSWSPHSSTCSDNDYYQFIDESHYDCVDYDLTCQDISQFLGLISQTTSTDDGTSDRDTDWDSTCSSGYDSDEEVLCNGSSSEHFDDTQSTYYYDDDDDDDDGLDNIELQDPEDDDWDDEFDLQDPDGFDEFETDVNSLWKPLEEEERTDFRFLGNIQRSGYGHRLGRHTKRRKRTQKRQIYQSRRKKSHQTAADNFSIDIHEDEVWEDQMNEDNFEGDCFSSSSSQLEAKITLLDFFPMIPWGIR